MLLIIRLIIHNNSIIQLYLNNNIDDGSIVQLKSTYTPKPNDLNIDLENICRELKHTKTSFTKTKGNRPTLRKGSILYLGKFKTRKLLYNLQKKVQLSL